MPRTAAQQQLVDFSQALTDLVAAAAPSVVSVRSSRHRSSGFAWRPGLIVTADDPLPDDGDLQVTLPGGETVAATVAGRDPTTDIAVLRIERTDLPALSSGAPAKAGALVVAVGNEEGGATAANGAVAFAGGPWQSMRGGEISARVELNLAMRRSTEGGPVIDATGAAVGMAVFGPRGRVLVIPAATIERVAAQLAGKGRVPRGYLGLGLQAVPVEGGKSGTMVMSVDPDGPGAKGGIRQGDILTAWNGEPVGSVASLLRVLGPESVGQSVRLDLTRAGQTMQVTITIGEKPAT